MATKPCRICRKWFEPHPRAGNRQTVCSSADCQRARNRKACGRWRAQNPNYDRDRRLRERIEKASAPPGTRPTAKVVWSAVQHAVGLEVGVVIEESVGHIELWVQHTVAEYLHEKPSLSAKVVAVPAQQQLEPMGPEP